MPDPTTLTSMGVGAADLFATGQIAMLCTGYWTLIDVPERWDDIEVGLTWFPSNSEGNHGWETGGTCYCIAAGSKNPELAYQFVKYFMTEPGWEAASAAATYGMIYPPAHIPSYEKYVINNVNIKIPNVAINGEAVPYAIFDPMIPLWPEISSKIVDPGIEEIELGYISVEDGLKDITERVNEALETGEVF